MQSLLYLVLFFSLSTISQASSLQAWIHSINQSQSIEEFGEKLAELHKELDHNPQLIKKQDCELLKTKSFQEIGALYSLSLEHPELFPTLCNDQIRLKAAITKQHFSSSKENRIKIKPVSVQAPLVNEISIDYRKGPVLIHAGLQKGFIALTFDDGPHKNLSSEILQILNEENLKANFFTVGKQVEKYPDVVKLGIEQGNTYGSHSYDHSNLKKISSRKAKANIKKGIDSLENLSNQSQPFFRFPYGSKNSGLKKYVKNYPLADFYWSLDTQDWKIREPEKLYASVVKQINEKQSGIVLFHDIQPQTRSILATLLKNLKRAGYKFVIFKK